MTERKWTPGPWAVEVDETAAQVQGFPCIEATDYTVVGTEGMYGDIETDYANAHLIAAAPDLYEALVDLVNHTHDCEKELTERLYNTDFCGESLPLTNARQSLKKAQGDKQ